MEENFFDFVPKNGKGVVERMFLRRPLPVLFIFYEKGYCYEHNHKRFWNERFQRFCYEGTFAQRDV